MTTITKEQALAILNDAADYLAESCGSPETAAFLRATLTRYIEQQSENDRDAARYRWLRTRRIEFHDGPNPDPFEDRFRVGRSALDAAIDAAMAKESAAAAIGRDAKESAQESEGTKP